MMFGHAAKGNTLLKTATQQRAKTSAGADPHGQLQLRKLQRPPS
jgi:hypothetical protein